MGRLSRVAFASLALVNAATSTPPNILVVLVDDNGWGDLGASGANPPSETPHMDALAASGIRFTDFHALPLCTPSRAQLLTGRLGLRTGVVANFNSRSLYGLPLGEITLAEQLKRAKPVPYATGMVGKFHLGHVAPFHPSFRGFDMYTGLPYSVDDGCIDSIPWFTPDTGADLPYILPCKRGPAGPGPVVVDASAPGTIPVNSTRSPGLPLSSSSANCSGSPSCNSTITAQPLDLTSLTEVYVGAAEAFIAAASGPGKPPFFLYAAFAHTHAPLAYARRWLGTSLHNTTFYDTMRELDSGVGRIMSALDAAGVRNETLVILAADNGPPKSQCDWAGHTGPFSGTYQQTVINPGSSAGKGTTCEGGHRVYGVFSWPGHIPAGGVTDVLASTLDVFPTLSSAAGVPLPADRSYDGVDLGPFLWGDKNTANAPRSSLFIPTAATLPAVDGQLFEARWGNYSIYWASNSHDGCRVNFSTPPFLVHNPPLAFDLTVDPAESQPVMLPPGILAAAEAARAALLADVNATFRSVVDWSDGPGGVLCCNASHADCRCTM